MEPLDDGPTVGIAGATGAIGSSIGVNNGVVGSGAGCTGTVGTTTTKNAMTAIGATSNVVAALPADATSVAAGASTANVVASTRAVSAGAPRATCTSKVTVDMIRTTNADTACTIGTASQEDPDKNQERPTWTVLCSVQIILFRIPFLRRIS